MSLLPQPLAPDFPFSAAIPSSGGSMGRVCVTSPIAFSMALDPQNGTLAQCELVADGSHISSFPGFTWPGVNPNSFNWVNTPGLVHSIVFEWDTNWPAPQYQITAISTSAIPCVTGLSVVHGLNPTIVINTGGAPLVPVTNTQTLAALAALFSLQTPLAQPPVAVSSVVSVSASQIVLALTGTVRLGDVVTLNFKGGNPGQPAAVPYLQDQFGNALAGFVNASVTVS